MEVIPRLHGGYTLVAWRLYPGCMVIFLKKKNLDRRFLMFMFVIEISQEKRNWRKLNLSFGLLGLMVLVL